MLCVIAYRPLRVNHDSGMYLQAGALLLEGQVPYVDFVDLNPPLIVYLSAIPAGIARVLHAHSIPVFLVLVWLAVAVSSLAAASALRGTLGPRDGLPAELLAVALVVVSLFLLRSASFGQREHLFALALLPYLVVRHRTWSGGAVPHPLAALAGVVAGIGACLKPHFVLVALAPEAYWVLSRRRLGALIAPETVGLTAAGVGYAAHFLVVPDAMRTAFFERWLGLVADGYRVYDVPFRAVVRRADVWLPPMLAAAVLFVRPRRAGPAWDLARGLAVAALAGVVAYFAQHKGWPYHAIPAWTLLAAVAALATAELLPSPVRPAVRLALVTSPGASRAVALAVAGALAAAAGILALGSPVERQRDAIVASSAAARAVETYTDPDDPVLVLSSSVATAYPLLTQLGRRPGSRLLWLFPIPMFYSEIAASEGEAYPYRTGIVPREEARILGLLRRDVARRRPPLVLIQARGPCFGCPRGFRMLDYLDRIGFIDTALADYRRLGATGDSEAFVRSDRLEARAR
jgi:hypothetical protein